MRLAISAEAREELAAAYDFHEDQHPGLGAYFQSDRLVARRFPFSVYYEVRASTVVVVAVFDCRMNLVEIRRRLRSS